MINHFVTNRSNTSVVSGAAADSFLTVRHQLRRKDTVMWGFSIPINLYTLLFAIMGPLVLLMLLVQHPTIALILGALVVALVARRRAVRRSRAAEQAEAIDQHERNLAELQAEAIERRLMKGQP